MVNMLRKKSHKTYNARLETSYTQIFTYLSTVRPVNAKYAGHAGHVRQTSADVRQRVQTLPEIIFAITADIQV